MKFKKIDTEIPGLFIIEPKLIRDDRGFFMESYNKYDFEKIGIKTDFIQDNHSKSRKGTLRGLHFQTKNVETKLVRVIKGKVYDVVVDLRKKSPNYGQYFSTFLSDKNKLMLYIPKGFAHGFLALTETVEFLYKVDDIFNAEAGGGIIWNDAELNINWPLKEYGIDEITISNKDSKLPNFNDFESIFEFK